MTQFMASSASLLSLHRPQSSLPVLQRLKRLVPLEPTSSVEEVEEEVEAGEVGEVGSAEEENARPMSCTENNGMLEKRERSSEN